MALVPCTECGARISNMATSCPQCGIQPEKPKKANWWLRVPLILLGLFVAFIAFGMVVGSTPEAQERSKNRYAIEYCWSEQKKPSVEPEAARFMAGACEKMEAEFRQKYGLNL